MYVWGVVHDLFDENFLAYIDKNEKIKEKNGVKVISIDEADITKRIYISPKYCHKEIKQILIKKRWIGDIVDVGEALEQLAKKQYFNLAELYHCAKEYFVDVGAFDGDSTLQFIEWAKDSYDKILCFEPDVNNVDRFCERIPDIRQKKIELIKKGAWSSDAILSFKNDGIKSGILETGENKVEVCKIDDVVDKGVTYIKMDIEGAEEQAIIGAAKTIKRDKPKLAIAIYHKKEDIFVLPDLILRLNPDYKLYFRHYTFSDADTVMYAV